ncbi:hypothetical protein TWF696_003992 [Orbilia brochopaga]|uniref:Myb-like DNA-binding domain-containing protein n=1 Tax=Orbilia brochopaga TaxID=3140254 RepID=A0AAV9V4X4_9PEZI
MKASSSTISRGSGADNETFLLCCLEHVQDLKIDFAAVAKDLGYSSATAAGNRLRNMRRKIQSDKGEKQKEAPALKGEKDIDTKPKTAKIARGTKRKKTASADENDDSE